MENFGKLRCRTCKQHQGLFKISIKTEFCLAKKTNENSLLEGHKIKNALTLNKPSHVGMSILELNNTLMYEFHY